ncbi:MAG: cytochrome C [Methanosarcinales archaeon]|nr:cytochrome C [Methanosarcinales archaeon]
MANKAPDRLFQILKPSLIVTILVLALSLQAVQAESVSTCINCHVNETPNIVAQWQGGKMGQNGLDCQVCHSSEHKDSTDVAKAGLPTPDTCKACHPQKVEQFRAGKHSLAWTAMNAMPMITHQPSPIVGSESFKGCSGCHKIGEKSAGELKEFRYGTGSCDSCHTRHSFSISEALDPRACQTCHMGFDHPQWEMWSTSKHGTIWFIEGDSGRAPKCQTCHMAEGNHAVMTAWGFLALRVPEDDQQWWADRVEILKALGVLDEKGNGTERFDAVKAAKVARLTKEDFQAQRATMEAICTNCHSANYVAEQMAASDKIVRETDKIMAEGIRTVKGLYDDGLLAKPEDWEYAPDLLQFYEAKSSVEQELYVMFLEYRMRAFQGAFHGNPDYMHWYGWAAMKESLQKIKDEADKMRAEAAAEDTGKEAKSVAYLALGTGIVALAISLFVIFRFHRLHKGRLND